MKHDKKSTIRAAQKELFYCDCRWVLHSFAAAFMYSGGLSMYPILMVLGAAAYELCKAILLSRYLDNLKRL